MSADRFSLFVVALLAACRETPPSAAPLEEPTVVATEAPASAPPTASDADAEDVLVELLARMGVRLDRNARLVEVEGHVNMQEGLVEVFACAPLGKTHESVVVLDCVPSGLHAGLLALDLHEGTPVEVGTDGVYHAPTGPGVEIEVRWTDGEGEEQVARAEDWVWNQVDGRAMDRAPWIFAGSFFQAVTGKPGETTYAANYVKSLVTTYHDASSILENPHTQGIDDTVYYANDRAVPPVGTPIRVTFRPAQ